MRKRNPMNLFKIIPEIPEAKIVSIDRDWLRIGYKGKMFKVRCRKTDRKFETWASDKESYELADEFMTKLLSLLRDKDLPE